MGDLGSIPGLGRSPGEGKGYTLQYSSLEKSMDCIVCGVTKIWTRLSDFHFSTRHLSLYFLFCVHGGAYRRNPGLTGLAGQDMGLILPLFCCFGSCFMLLLHVLLLNKPA